MQIFTHELIGTFILVLAVLSSHSMVFIAFAFLAAILIANSSGSHINPAITLTMYLKGAINSSQIPEYLIGQILGAIIALKVSQKIN